MRGTSTRRTEAPGVSPTFLRRRRGVLRAWWDRLAGEFGRFGTIGFFALFVDMGAYAFFTYGWFGPTNGPLYGHEKIASVSATAVASVFSWVCNRYWTYRHRRGESIWREFVLFAFFNAVGALITMACVALAIDVLHLTGLAWESAARGGGIALGTLFRFWSYRTFVFVPGSPLNPPRPTGGTTRTAPGGR